MAKKRRPQRFPNSHHELDIVIPVYGQPDLLRDCLKGVEMAGLDVDYQLFIVDDFSPNPDEMNVIYYSLNGTAKVAKNAQNRGFPYTVNRGVSLGTSPAILLLNSDVILQSGALRTMLKMLWADKPPHHQIDPLPPGAPVGVVAPKLLFPPDQNDPHRPAGKIQHAGMAFNGAGKPVHVNIGWSADNPKVNIPRSLQIVSGACLMTKREVWNQVTGNYNRSGDPTSGAFNEMYGRGTYEDIEYCLAVRGHGYKVIYEPGAIGYHYTNASIKQVIEESGEGYPMLRNESIFRARCGHMIFWDEWLWY